MKNVQICDMTRLCLLVTALICTTETLPIGLQKYLSGNNYQVILGPKEFVSKYDQPSKGTFVRQQDDSSTNSDSEYVIYGKFFILKKKMSAKLRAQDEESNGIIPRDFTNRIQKPSYIAKSESFEEESSIVFPKDTQEKRTEYKRFDYDSQTDDPNFYKPAELTMERLGDGNISPIPIKPRTSDSGKLQKGTGSTDTEPELILDQEESASAASAVFQMENKKQDVPLGVVSIQDLEKWADVYKTTTTSSPQITNNNSTANDTDLSFQSLFIVPSLKNPQGGCPEGKRKNHAGVCVSPYVHKGNSNAATSSTRAKPMTSSSTPIQTTLESLMESLRSVELQALQALLGSTQATTTSESATDIPDAIQIRSRIGFPTSDSTTNNPSEISSPSSTPKSNTYVYSLLTPLKHQRLSDFTLEASTESSLLETLKEYGKINFDFSKVQQIQRKFSSAQRHS